MHGYYNNDQENLNAEVFPKDDPTSPRLVDDNSHLRGYRSCSATKDGFNLDAGGLTAAAWNEMNLARELQEKLANPELARRILVKRTAQSLARLDQVITAVLEHTSLYNMEKVDTKRLTLRKKVAILRKRAGNGGDFEGWRHLVPGFERNLTDIQEIWSGEMASPGSSTLEELAELRFSFVSTYTHALESMIRRYPNFVEPVLTPEMDVMELREIPGILPIVKPSEATFPED